MNSVQAPFLKLPLLLISALLLNGCVFSDRSEDYQRAGSIPPIQVPEGITSEPLDPLYPIPPVIKRDDAFYDVENDGFVVPRPEPMSADAEQTKVKIQKVGKNRWIVLEASTSQVWPLAQSFLSRNGIRVAKTEPAVGLIETDWVGFKDDDNNKSQFQIRIEKGVRPEVTEVHILHKEVPNSVNGPTPWPAESDDIKRESWLLEAMGTSLADDVRNKAASLLGQSVGGEIKAQLAVERGEPVLFLALDSQRAWATVAHALRHEGFQIWDEKDKQNIFYVQYIIDNKRPGWFKRMFLPKSKKPVMKAPKSLDETLQTLQDTPAARQLFGDVPTVSFIDDSISSAGYLVRLTPEKGKMVVRIRDHQGRILDSQLNKKMLLVLRRNLI